jgi:hypothetical protein
VIDTVSGVIARTATCDAAEPRVVDSIVGTLYDPDLDEPGSAFRDPG